MKRRKITKIALIAASAILSSGFGGVLCNTPTWADDAATEKTYALSTMFAGQSSGAIATEPETVGTEKVATFTLPDEGGVIFKRNLALKWYEESGAQFLTVKFAFKEINFQSVTLSMDSVSAWATKDDKATNVLTFKNDNGTLKASVNGDETKVGTYADAAGKVFTLKLMQEDGAADGEFGVKLYMGDDTVGTSLAPFTNIGANYAKYTANSYYPLSFKADLGENVASDVKSTLYIYEINNQKFTGVTTENTVVDTAAPILVVNDEFDGFLLGTKFSLNDADDDYKLVDVVQDTSKLTKTLRYYQYDPAAEAITAGKEKDAYSALSTSTVFFPTVYKNTQDVWTTVYDENDNKEFVSIYMELGDEVYSKTAGDEGVTAADKVKKLYSLSWYAAETGKGVGPTDATKDPLGYDWIYLNRNESGAGYNHITADEKSKTNKEKTDLAAYNLAKASFQEKLDELAAEVYAGSNSELKLPSLKWLLNDNNGYRSLKFSISYYTPTSSANSPSTSSNLDFNELEIPTASEGWYKFKIFANDTAGNKMQYYLDGKLTDVTANNVWDFEEIPVFTFKVNDKGLRIEEESSSSKRKDTKVKDASYTLSSSYMKVIGATDLQKDYALYKIDLEDYNLTAAKKLDKNDLTAITYEMIAAKVKEKGFASVEGKDYFTYYLTIYAELLIDDANATSDDIQKLVDCFKMIGEKGDNINNATEDFEKFEWNPSSPSFKTVETGDYLLLADFWEGNVPSYRAAAYRLVTVESEVDKASGDTDWFKNNVVSIILFAIAGVMLILIIILLLIKPSDETLEDVDVKAAKLGKAKKKQDEDEE